MLPKDCNKKDDYKKKMSEIKTKYLIERELLESLYWGNGYDLTELGNIFGCDRKTIHFKMIKMDIPRRDAISKDGTFTFKGMHHTEESKESLRKFRLGKKQSKETKEKISLHAKDQWGEKNCNWKGGTSKELYPHEFNARLKRKVKKRDNYTCQECGYTWEQLGKRITAIHVHHIDYNKNNNAIDNLITLCNSCHSQTNFDRDDWKEYFKKKLIRGD